MLQVQELGQAPFHFQHLLGVLGEIARCSVGGSPGLVVSCFVASRPRASLNANKSATKSLSPFWFCFACDVFCFRGFACAFSLAGRRRKSSRRRCLVVLWGYIGAI